MKSFCLKMMIALAAASACDCAQGSDEAVASSTSTNSQPAAPESTFIVPTSSKEGRDPFFPRSVRIYAQADLREKKTRPVVTADVEIKGFSGTPDRPLVILNNQTFGLDEESPLITDSGRVLVHVTEIRIGEGATIELEGEKMVLQYNQFRFK